MILHYACQFYLTKNDMLKPQFSKTASFTFLVLIVQCQIVVAQVAPDTPIAIAHTAPASVSRAECFPVETLPADLRPLAEELLLKIMDSEALYTVIGGLKPMSGGYVQTYLSTDSPDTASVERTRQALSALRCGDWFRADMLMFARVGADKKRYVEGVIVCVPTYRRMVDSYAPFWATWGITPTTDPMAAIVFAENDNTSARNRALGYLYGYPKPAVDFFVAGMEDERTKKSKTVTPRDFRQIPTFSAPTSQFVYAVPKGTPESAEDIRLRTEAGRILAAYRVRRAAYIGDGKPGIVALLRDWFDDGRGQCSPRNARFYEALPNAPAP